jgi:aspartate kinase
MTDLVVAKFGGTSVADFDAMNRSVDVALLDANTRRGVIRLCGRDQLLVALAEGLEPAERFESSTLCARFSSISWSVCAIPT